MSDHKCPILGCHTRVPSSLVMCRHHWRMVDTVTQNAVYDAYRTRPRSTEHYGLVRDAVSQVMKKIGQVPS